MYGLFGGFVIVAFRSGGVVRSCGCVGRADTPPTPLHLLLDVLGVTAGVAAAFAGDVTWVGGPPTETVLVIGAIAIATWLGYAIVATPMRWDRVR